MNGMEWNGMIDGMRMRDCIILRMVWPRSVKKHEVLMSVLYPP